MRTLGGWAVVLGAALAVASSGCGGDGGGGWSGGSARATPSTGGSASTALAQVTAAGGADATAAPSTVSSTAAAASAASETGSFDPGAASLGLNLAAVNYYTPERPFVDVMKTSQVVSGAFPWHLQGGGTPPAVDAQGYPRGLARGQSAVTYSMRGIGGRYPTGAYVVLFEGDGTVELAWDGGQASHSHGGVGTARFVANVTRTSDAGFTIRITRSNASNHVRNLRVIMPGFEGSYASDPFHPRFLERIAPFTVLRFADWGKTNDSTVSSWSQRTSPDYRSMHAPTGVAYEVMIDLCNRAGKHMWVCVPHLANDDYVRQLATLVRGRLRSDLKVFVELSNEVWHGGHQQFHDMTAQARAKGLSLHAWYAQRSVQVFQAFEQAMGGRDRLVRVLASQHANPTVTDQILAATPAGAADVLAIAPFFGYPFGRESAASTVRTWSVDKLLTEFAAEAAKQREFVRKSRQQAAAKGLKLVGYAGGQHLAAQGAAVNDSTLVNLFIAANRHARMGQIYRDFLADWAAEGGGVLVHFNDVFTPSQWGSWGALEYLDQDPATAPKYAALVDVAAQWASPPPGGGDTGGGDTGGGGTGGGDTGGGDTGGGDTGGGDTGGGDTGGGDTGGGDTGGGDTGGGDTGGEPVEFDVGMATLGTNLSPVNYYTPERPFVDVMKTSRVKDGFPWELSGSGSTPQLDAQGYPIGLASGQVAYTTAMVGISGRYPKGQYVVLFEGNGAVELRWDGGSASYSHDGSGTARFVANVTSTSSSGFTIRITRSSASNHVRNLRVIMPGFEGTYDKNPFHPLFLERIAPFSVLRFMDWGATNNSNVTSWSQRKRPDYRSMHGPGGVAYEVMADLCNLTKKHMWICVPHKANDDYVRQLATLLRDRVDPSLKIFVEYSNEVWNGGFRQYADVNAEAQKRGLSWYTWYAQRAVQIFKIFEQVMGGTSRLVRVLGSQHSNPWIAKQILAATPAGAADALAIAPYFGHELGKESTASTVRGYSVSRVLDECAKDLAEERDYIRQNRAHAEAKGMKLVAYEGGQHLVGTGKAVDDSTLTNLFIAANRHTRMGQIYRDYLAMWKAEGGGTFVHFNDVYVPQKWGSWGALEYLDQDPATAPKYTALVEVAAQWNPAPGAGGGNSGGGDTGGGDTGGGDTGGGDTGGGDTGGGDTGGGDTGGGDTGGGDTGGGDTGGGDTGGGDTGGGDTGGGNTGGGGTGGGGTQPPVPPSSFDYRKATIGTNLTAVSYYSPQWPFVDVMKSTRVTDSGFPWELSGGTAPAVDAQGYPIGLASGQVASTMAMVGIGNHWPGGRYVVLFEGNGTVELVWDGGRASYNHNGSGTARFTADVTPDRHGLTIRITRSSSSNHVRNLRVIMPGFEATYAQNPFHPLFLERMKHATVLRFMDWGETNGSNISTWSQRKRPDYRSMHNRGGVAYEVMADLCNLTKKHMWICVPHKANDDYVRQLATLLRDRLDPSLKVFVEYSNEVWNGGFRQYSDVNAEAQKRGVSWYTWYAQRSVQIFKIFEQVMGGTSRLVRVLGSQHGNPWIAKQILAATPTGAADALAIAPYFGHELGYENTLSTVRSYSVSRLLDECVKDLAEERDLIRQNRAYAEAKGMALIAYEGGQHLVGVGRAVDDSTLTNLFISANRNSRMRDVYRQYLDIWKAEGGGAFVHFNDVWVPQKWGSWGSLEYQDQDPSTAPKYQALIDAAARWTQSP